MRYRELIEWGKVVPGVNTTPDVQPGEIKRQAAKFGFAVDENGLPPIWTGAPAKTGAKDTPNKNKPGQKFYGADGRPPNKKAPVVESVDHELRSHINGDVAYLDDLEVAEPGLGHGTAVYRQWEASLPENVKLVHLWAIGPGAAEFWGKMGFEFQYVDETGEDDDTDPDEYLWMWKGVNGHPTPPSTKP